MNRNPLPAAVLLLYLAASAVARAQEGTKKAGSGEAVPLYAKEGKALIDSLERNFYGRDTGKALTSRGSAYLFSPTDPKDHLATPFLHLPAPSGDKVRVARISLSFSEPEPSPSDLVILVQDGGLATLQQFQPHPEPAAALSFSRDVRIPPSASSLRLAFLSPESRPTDLPNRVAIECRYSGPEESGGGERWAFYVLLAAIGILAVVAILCRMGKKKLA